MKVLQVSLFLVLLLTRGSDAFLHHHHQNHGTSMTLLFSYSNHPHWGQSAPETVTHQNDPNVFPSSSFLGNDDNDNDNAEDNDNDNDDVPSVQENTRFSAFAPDLALEAEDFRNQLKENMKADLERRRHSNPNRGNQPAKSYLDSL